ncbi:MAG: hypothetical protein P8K80_10945 [Phycisphaerales bacterium]|nr:hypothetical protein [Phycisphaerales bacterium]
MKTMHACAAFAATFAFGSTVLGAVIQTESFEAYTAGSGYYVDADAATDHWLVNYDDHTVSGDGWGTYYTNTRDGSGLSDGDYFGVTSYAGAVGGFTHGEYGFQMSDVDGMATMVFDAVEGATGVSFDMFVDGTGWEGDDLIKIEIGGVVVLDTTGHDIDDDFGHLEEAWTTFNGGAGELRISLDSNSGSEAIFIDNIQWTGVPAPGALALLGLAGLATRRRRH